MVRFLFHKIIIYILYFIKFIPISEHIYILDIIQNSCKKHVFKYLHCL